MSLINNTVKDVECRRSYLQVEPIRGSFNRAESMKSANFEGRNVFIEYIDVDIGT